jgi:carbon-monoxide dehydrogenase medium subunit
MFDHIEGFYQPASVREAVLLLRKTADRGKIVAGATDIITRPDRSIRFLIDITRLGLDYIRPQAKGYALGATVTMATLERSARVRAFAGGILAQAAASCGSMQNRQLATLGGNLANGSPAADSAAVLLALDAQVALVNSRRTRQIPLAEFYQGPHQTVLNGDLLEEVILPALPTGGRWGWSFQKLGRTETDISVVNVAAGLQIDGRGRIKAARLALGAVAPTPWRARTAESLLLGITPSENLLAGVASAVMQAVSPISDARASAEYRREMSAVLTRRALSECCTQIGLKL